MLALKLRASGAVGGSGSGVSITSRSINNNGVGARAVTYRINATGVVERGRNGIYATLETWLLSGAASGYDSYVTVTSGALTAGTTGAWLNLGTTRDWTLTAYNPGDDFTCIMTVQIRNASSLVVLATATITLNAISF